MSRIRCFIRAAWPQASVLKAIFAAIALFAGTACVSYHETGEQIQPESSAYVSPDVAIPEVFFGCWEGTINGFDSVTPLSFAGHFITGSMKTVYQFCLRPVEGGGAVMQLTKLEIEGHQATVKRFDNHITATYPERPGAHLRNHLLIESTAYLFYILPVKSEQDIFAEEDIVMTPQGVIAMQGKQLARMNGQDIAEITFHGDFYRVAGS